MSFDMTAEEIRNCGTYWRNIKGPYSTYSAWLLEWNDHNIVAVIHEKDDEVAAVIDAHTGDFVSLHPTTVDGLNRILGAL